jgi:hypothetical protein
MGIFYIERKYWNNIIFFNIKNKNIEDKYKKLSSLFLLVL